MTSSEDEVRLSSTDSEDGRGRLSTCSSEDSRKSAPTHRPTHKTSPTLLSLCDRLQAEGYSVDDIRGLVASFEVLPLAFRGNLLLRTKDLLLPLDAGVMALRKDLISADPEPVAEQEPVAGPSTVPRPPREDPDLPISSTRLPHEDPAPNVPRIEVTVTEEAGRVLKFIPAEGSVGGTRPAGEPLPNVPQAPPAAKRSGTSHLGEPPPPNPKASKRDGCQICGGSSKFGLRWHMAEFHLPWFFFASSACFVCRKPFRTTALLHRHRSRCHDDDVINVDKDHLVWVRGMMDLLGTISTSLGFVTPHMLPSFCSQRGIMASEGAHFQHTQLSNYGDLALVMGAPLREPLQVRPPNHPVAALHWEVLLGLLGSFHSLVGKTQQIDPPRNTPNYFHEDSTWVEMADGHCHLNTALLRHKLSINEAVPRWASNIEGCRMAFVVDNRVFGGDWAEPFPTSVPLPGPGGHLLRVHYTFGVHPRVASGPPGTLEKLKELAGSDRCVGIGEFGLDKTSPEGTWAQQTNVFRKQAKLGCSLKKALVLHLRGSATVPLGAVLKEACDLLTEVDVPHRHAIYLHCFLGTVEQLHAWWKKFPNTYFGVSSKALEPGTSLEFARGIDLDKFILESDSPYLGLGERPTTPWCLPKLAVALGGLRNVPTRAILRLSRTNAMALYGIAG